MKTKKKMTPLGKRRRRRKRVKLLIFALLIVLIVLGGYYIVKSCRVRKLVIRGNVTYTPGEIENQIKKENFVPNSLLMTIHNRIFRLTYLPFIHKMKMSMNPAKPDILLVDIKEKPRAGVFEYMNKFFYFNEDGYVMESRNSLFENVPIVTGVEFSQVRPEEKIRAKGNYCDSVISLVRGIRNNNLTVYEIHFDSEKDITLDCGSFKVYLGPPSSLDEKIARIPSILEAVAKEHEGGTVDMHLFTEDKEYITFR